MRAFKASIGKRAERCGTVTRCAASVCMEIGVGLKRRQREKFFLLDLSLGVLHNKHEGAGPQY